LKSWLEMEKTLVVGGSGFIGSAIQHVVLDEHSEDLFTFSFSKKPEKLDKKLNTVHLDLLEAKTRKEITKYPMAVYVAGNADHGLAKRSPLLDLDLNARAFLNFMQEFRGSLVLLSSQAVYYGLEGEILETVDHIPTIPYGLSKQMMEAYAKYFLRNGSLSKLWIFRLAYAFGKGEKEYRLIPRCANAVRKNERVAIFGGGKSFINPLPAEFVAKTLLKAAENLKGTEDGIKEITNINYPEKVTVRNVVFSLNRIKRFDFALEESGEDWPVTFWGNTQNLSKHLSEWKMEFPDLWVSLKKYFIELVEGKTDD
jgi:nucleoside-diphosphate-sugar epimerase